MRKLKLVLGLLVILLFLAGCSSQSPDNVVKVTRAVDGDTIEVTYNGKEEKVRLIGVDTPETKHPTKPVEPYGPEASAFTKKTLEGKKVRLEFDVQERDKYGRLLAYLYLEDGTFFNAELLRQGFAQVLTVPPNVRHADEFVKLQREAREAKRGLWGLEHLGASPALKAEKGVIYIGNRNSKKFHRPDCVFGKSIAEQNRVIFKSRDEALDNGFASCRECQP